MSATQKVLILCPYPVDEAPSQRFRFEQYLPFLKEQGIEITQSSCLDEETGHKLYLPGNIFSKLGGILKGFARRKLLMFTLFKYDLIFIHREASPLGPPVFEWIITKIWKKKTIYDFDDAIWMENISQQNALARWFKHHSKVSKICSWATTVTTGNNYLAEYAKGFCDDVRFVPTTLHVPSQKKGFCEDKRTTIGWTGSHSTLKYLDLIKPVLDRLIDDYDFEFIVISNQPPSWDASYLSFKKWDKTSEVEDLLTFDIGLMPLKDDLWAKGKCGFKALQYMALGIPVIASPVGVNSDIIKEGENGLLATDENEWLNAIKRLLTDSKLRMGLGNNGRVTVEEKYSVEANKAKYLKLFTA